MNGVRPIADPFALERALRRSEEDLAALREDMAALRAAAIDVVESWKDPGAGGRSPYGSLFTLEKVLTGQGGVAAAVVKEGGRPVSAFPPPRRYGGGPLEDGVYLYRRPTWHPVNWTSFGVAEDFANPYVAPKLLPGEWVWLVGPLDIPAVPPEGAAP